MATVSHPRQVGGHDIDKEKAREIAEIAVGELRKGRCLAEVLSAVDARLWSLMHDFFMGRVLRQ